MTTSVLRRGIGADTFGGGEADQLPGRGALGVHAKAAVEAGHATAVTGFRTCVAEQDGDGRLALTGKKGRRLEPVDEVTLTGLRPELSFLSELRLSLDERLQASCGTVYPHGALRTTTPAVAEHLAPSRSAGPPPPPEAADRW